MKNFDPAMQDKSVNLSYPLKQISHALLTQSQHIDPATRQRAAEKIQRWETCISNMQSGQVNIGSRTPLANTPSWVTLEVLKGGFASGGLMAGGPLLAHEEQMLSKLGPVAVADARQALNTYFLSADGLAELMALLQSGFYQIKVPEEGALLMLAWLIEHEDFVAAQNLLTEISAFFPKLRFYPQPHTSLAQGGSRVHVQDLRQTIRQLKEVTPNPRLLAQKEAVEIWAPFYDRMIALVLQSDHQGQFCQHFPAGWLQQASDLLQEFNILRERHPLCSKPNKPKLYFAQLRGMIQQCVEAPHSLRPNQIEQIGRIVRQSLHKRGTPDSVRCQQQRQRQQQDVSAPGFVQFAHVLIQRLSSLNGDDGLEDVQQMLYPINAEEAQVHQIELASAIPLALQKKVARCLHDFVAILVERGLITSAEVLAQVLPQITAEVGSASLADPALRVLYAAIYRAFRARRSLLLLDLQHQVRMEELPWMQALEKQKQGSLPKSETARQALLEVCSLALSAFPYAILPNLLLQEIGTLAQAANLKMPIVEELAADIFMRRFSKKFILAGQQAAQLLHGSLYAIYYDIDYDQVLSLEARDVQVYNAGRGAAFSFDPLCLLCANRAGVNIFGHHTVENGMLIEQQQILTSQNLASLFIALDLGPRLQAQLLDMARTCFLWICQRQKMKVNDWHSDLIMIKNTAYAWRQMVFFLALTATEEQADFLHWTQDTLAAQTEHVQKRLQPALLALQMAAEGKRIGYADVAVARRFLGWSNGQHWMQAISAHSA